MVRTVDAELHTPIATEADIVLARQHGRNLAASLGASLSEVTLIATAISELARNIVSYAKQGEIVLSVVEGSKRGIRIVARDQGPGIADIDLAMRDGYSTGGGLGLGLPGARRLMDEFTIVSELGKGTTISMTKWVR
jgi:serine/threonine-protein kinase RsbT